MMDPDVAITILEKMEDEALVKANHTTSARVELEFTRQADALRLAINCLTVSDQQ